MSLRQAAWIAGFCLLIMSGAAPYAQFAVHAKLIVSGNAGQTVANIAAHRQLFVSGILADLGTYILDVVVAWALFVLLAPVNRAVSLLAAWFRVVFAVIALISLFKLGTVFRILGTPEYLELFGAGPLQAQVKLLLDSSRDEMTLGLVIFGLHLILAGWLVFRSGYIPRVLGILLAINGLGWVIDSLGPFLYPQLHLGFLFIAFFGELVLMLWLLARGWAIREPA